MTTASFSNTSAAVVGFDNTNSTALSPRRRGFSALRRLGPLSPAESSRISPRSYFARSVSYPQTSITLSPSNTPGNTPRPSEPPNQVANESIQQEATSSSSNKPLTAHKTESIPPESGAITSPAAHHLSPEPSDMARHRPSINTRGTVSGVTQNAEAQRSTAVERDSNVDAANSTNAQTNGTMQENTEEKPRPPTIRFFPHQELRQGRLSLTFAPVVRTLPSESSIIRIGRYSEREGVPVSNPNGPSDAPVGFKSKVVSRKHCEFSFLNGSWQIKDVSSSSGTFLNHIRLSQPNTESRLYPVKDGDIVQLGIDFRGGEEMIFRCVKIRIECNRAWQKRPNNFNMNRHAQLQKLGKADAKVDDNKGECAICLGEVAPCQSLFIAACAHVWHYKCIRRMLMGSNYPQFTCPNCRAITDLEAELDVEDCDGEEWEQAPDEPTKPVGNIARTVVQSASAMQDQHDTIHVGGALQAYDEAGDVDLTNIEFEGNVERTAAPSQAVSNGLLSRRQTSISAASPPMPPVNGIEIPRPSINAQLAHVVSNETVGTLRTGTPTSAEIIAGEGPLTPRNDAGPFVFDGSGCRGNARRLTVSAMDESD